MTLTPAQQCRLAESARRISADDESRFRFRRTRHLQRRAFVPVRRQQLRRDGRQKLTSRRWTSE